jgi:hypothetical protein
MKREKEDEEEDKKVVVPPVNRNLLPAANRKALIQDGGAQGRRKALRLHATYHAQNSACARCSPSPCPLGAWEVAIEPQPDRSVPPSERAAAAAAAKGRLVGRSSPERALWQRAGGGTLDGIWPSRRRRSPPQSPRSPITTSGAHPEPSARAWRQHARTPAHIHRTRPSARAPRSQAAMRGKRARAGRETAAFCSVPTPARSS